MTAPKAPWNGVRRWKESARLQSTVPASAGITAEQIASPTEAMAMTIASRVVRRTPVRLTNINASTITTASRWLGMNGRYHEWSASADRIAVRPQVGTQPHQ